MCNTPEPPNLSSSPPPPANTSEEERVKNVVHVPPNHDRRILDFRTLGFRDVVILGRNEYSHAQPPLARHCHRGMIEICLLERGCQVYVVEGEECLLEGGDIMVVYPDEVHGTGAYPEKGALYWMLLRVPRENSRFLSLAAEEWKPLFEPLLRDRPRKFKASQPLKQLLDSIFTVHDNADDPLRIVNLKNLMLRFMLDTVSCAQHPERRSCSNSIREVLEYIDRQLEVEEIDLQVLANQMGLSMSRFKARFKEEVGTPPAEYLNRRRVDRATFLLLETGLSITEIAMRLGFSTSQYFATVYKRFTGSMPSDIRNQRPPSAAIFANRGRR